MLLDHEYPGRLTFRQRWLFGTTGANLYLENKSTKVSELTRDQSMGRILATTAARIGDIFVPSLNRAREQDRLEGGQIQWGSRALAFSADMISLGLTAGMFILAKNGSYNIPDIGLPLALGSSGLTKKVMSGLQHWGAQEIQSRRNGWPLYPGAYGR